jgi:hypothetical protein
MYPEISNGMIDRVCNGFSILFHHINIPVAKDGEFFFRRGTQSQKNKNNRNCEDPGHRSKNISGG